MTFNFDLFPAPIERELMDVDASLINVYKRLIFLVLINANFLQEKKVIFDSQTEFKHSNINKR